MENAVHNDTQIVPLKINSIIIQTKAVQTFSAAFEFAEMFQIGRQNFLRQPAKFAEDVQLQFARHLCQFRRADRIENNLKLHFLKSLKFKAQSSKLKTSITTN